MVKRILCWLAAVVVLLTGTMAGALAEMPREIYPLDYDTLPVPRAGQYHYLMACVDTWQGSASNLGNTDGVLMVTLDVDAKRVMLTTFTREMLVKRPDGGIGRFTYIAKNYGPEALCETVSTHFGAKVDKYIIFSMDNVQTIIDAMGGVYITVTDAEADYLNRYPHRPRRDHAQHGQGGHLPVHRACGCDLHAHPQGGRRRRFGPHPAHPHGAEHACGQICPGLVGRRPAADYHRIGKHRNHQHEHGGSAGGRRLCHGAARRGAGRHPDAAGGGHGAHHLCRHGHAAGRF